MWSFPNRVDARRPASSSWYCGEARGWTRSRLGYSLWAAVESNRAAKEVIMAEDANVLGKDENSKTVDGRPHIFKSL